MHLYWDLFNPTGHNCDRSFFLLSGSSKNVVIGQEIKLLNDKIDCLD